MITLTDAEMKRVTDFSVALIASKRKSTVEKYKLDGRADGDARVRRNVEGYMAEFAVAKELGLEFRDQVTKNNDNNYDLEYKGKLVGVKGTRYVKGTLLVKLQELARKIVPDYYVLAIVDVEAKTVDIKGGISTEYIRQNVEPSFVRNDTPPVYRVFPNDLIELKELLDA